MVGGVGTSISSRGDGAERGHDASFVLAVGHASQTLLRRVAVLGARRDGVGVRVQERGAHGRPRALDARRVEGSPTVGVATRGALGEPFQQRRDDVDGGAAAARVVQRRPSVAGRRLRRFRPRREQRLDHVELRALQTGEMDRQPTGHRVPRRERLGEDGRETIDDLDGGLATAGRVQRKKTTLHVAERHLAPHLGVLGVRLEKAHHVLPLLVQNVVEQSLHGTPSLAALSDDHVVREGVIFLLCLDLYHMNSNKRCVLFSKLVGANCQVRVHVDTELHLLINTESREKLHRITVERACSLVTP